MATYKVQQKATIWYQTEVEASSAVEAIQMVAEGAGRPPGPGCRWYRLAESRR